MPIKNAVFLILLIFIQSYDCPGQLKPPFSVSGISELETYLLKVTDQGIPPGLSLLVVKDSQIVYCKGFGWADKPRKIPATPETSYHWFSITKVITAMAILQLEEKGKLNVEDPVALYLPFFKVKYPTDSSRQITILDLLNHSSGLRDAKTDLIRWVHHDGEPMVNQTEMIKSVLPKYARLVFEPGSQTKYTNIGYMVLAAIIEQASGQDYEDYIRQNILVPLEMNRTDYVYTPAMEAHEAAGSHPLFDVVSLLIPFTVRTYVRETYKKQVYFKRFYTDQSSPSGLIGPVSDLALFMLAYLNNGQLHGNQVLSTELINKMTYTGFRSMPADSLADFSKKGIGWMVNRKAGRLMLSHTGNGIGFNTSLLILPEEKLGFVAFCNSTKFNAWQITDLAASLKW
jgi:CubicO group peptidase (beta-lactamase class C family)